MRSELFVSNAMKALIGLLVEALTQARDAAIQAQNYLDNDNCDAAVNTLLDTEEKFIQATLFFNTIRALHHLHR